MASGLSTTLMVSCAPKSYILIIDNQPLHHVLDGLCSDGHFLLVHDLSPIHMAHAVTAHLSLGAMISDWPPKGMDVDVIENDWGILKANFSKMRLHIATSHELQEAIKRQWGKAESWQWPCTGTPQPPAMPYVCHSRAWRPLHPLLRGLCVPTERPVHTLVHTFMFLCFLHFNQHAVQH